MAAKLRTALEKVGYVYTPSAQEQHRDIRRTTARGSRDCQRAANQLEQRRRHTLAELKRSRDPVTQKELAQRVVNIDRARRKLSSKMNTIVQIGDNAEITAASGVVNEALKMQVDLLMTTMEDTSVQEMQTVARRANHTVELMNMQEDMAADIVEDLFDFDNDGAADADDLLASVYEEAGLAAAEQLSQASVPIRSVRQETAESECESEEDARLRARLAKLSQGTDPAGGF